MKGRFVLARILLTAALLFSVRTAAAQDSPDRPKDDSSAALSDLAIEDLLHLNVYAASKFDQEVSRAPASVTIITAEEIRTHGYRTLADTLRSVRGFYVSYDRNYSYIGVRGFERPGDYNGRILLLVNGHQMNDTVFEQALLGTESPIDLALVDRVEIVRGPSSSLYGTSAFLAVVNLITRAGHALNGVEIDGGAGSLVTRNGRAAVGVQSRGWDTLISASAFASHGNAHLYYPSFDAPATNNGIVDDADGDRSAGVFASASGHGFDLQGAFGSRTKTIPTASFGTVFGDRRSRTHDARGFGEAVYTHAMSDRATIKGRLSYDHYDYDGTYPYEAGLFRDGADNSWITATADVVRLFERQTVSSGFEYRDNLRQNQRAADQDGVIVDDRRGSTTTALYAQDEFRVNTRLVLNAGLRWDHYVDTFGSTVNPRIGAIVSPTTSAALKALYGRAFRAPNPYELYYEGDAVSRLLKPENIATYEMVWEQRVAPRLHVTGSIFHNRVSNLINLQTADTPTTDGLQFANAQRAAATGVEVEAQAELPGRMHLRIADALQSAVDALDDSRLSNSPSQVGFLVVDRPLGSSGLMAAVNTWYIGARHTVTEARVPASIVTDFTLSKSTTKAGLGWSLAVHNLFDTAYSDPGSTEHRQSVIPQDGRTLALRATWHLR